MLLKVIWSRRLRATRCHRAMLAYPGIEEALDSTIAEGDAQKRRGCPAIAWADFNGDGVEDVAISVRNSMTEGSHSVARVMVVTRNTPTEVLRVIEMPAE